MFTTNKGFAVFRLSGCKHPRYFAEILTLHVTANPQNENFFINPRASYEEFFRLKIFNFMPFYPASMPTPYYQWKSIE